ncbi:six-hairpin glycosidase [Raphidocelis subcapitata]|uniref:cellulase n=1 Tax=Raphidocelis subcapitata TaxID=307507 RepID=A0A2V0PJ39_9CHLO|nr:six-hairpin glycosidase [Raphidocelis subcapitata]|eukprot:GBF97993.1 six-hairpin glycosidase [Raphidocelis subcapitata]
MGPPNLKPISVRAHGAGDIEAGRGGAGPSSRSSSPRGGRGAHAAGAAGAAGAADSDSPGMASDSSSPWRRFFRGGSRYPNSDADSFGNSPRNLMGFSPKASSASQSHMSTPTKRKYGPAAGAAGSSSSREYGPGQITAYGSGGRGNAAAGAVMMSLAEELLTKKGLSLKDLAEEQEEYAETGDKVAIPKDKRPVTKHWNWVGLSIFLFYFGSLIYYVYVRATKTLNMGYLGYGLVVLLIEVISSTATIGYAVLLIKYSKSRRTKGLPIAKKGQQPDLDNLAFHVRVLVPCYKESVDLVRTTVLGAVKAPLPRNTLRTVYLCDDGKDPAKEAMIRELNAEYGCLEYVTGRKRDPNGETNGKSNNLNFCLRNVIYKDYFPVNKDGPKIPKHEVMVVFDADMVAKPNFFTKVRARSAFVQGGLDIFNNLNLSFWEYMLPGTDALGYIACTGTNFCLRCAPLADCGFFPSWTITEDYALGMILKAKHYKAGYLNEYLAIGEAPEEIRNIFRQRSRWCKGQMQVLFSRSCPLFDTGLTIGMRLLYTSVTWSYITNTFAVPCAVFVPFIALVFGVYPLVLNRDFALAATLYFSASTLVTSYCTNRKHIKPLWFCIVSCHLLWFTFTKALLNVLLRKITKKKVVFKSTKKKGEDDGRGAKPTRKWLRPPANVGDMEGTFDAWVLVLSFFFSFITAVVGLFQIIDKPFTAQGDFKFYLMLSVFWAVYNMIPPSLFIFYCYQKGHLFEDFCSFCLTLSFLVAIAGILCTWLVPDDYNMSQVLNVSLQFFEAQRSGKVPRISNTPWRGNSGLWDSVGDMTKDRAYWGSPEKYMGARPATYLSAARPGGDAVAMISAALASAAVAIQEESLQVADVYLQKAISLYTLNYLNDALVLYDQTVSSEGHVNPNPYMFNYENVVPALDLLLAKALKGTPEQKFFKDNVANFVKTWMNTKSTTGDIYYTKKYLAKAYPYGTLQHTANAAFYVLSAAKDVLESKFMLYACWSRNQIGYMLGDAGRSYVTGYGGVSPQKTPHKAASCPPPDVADCTWESAYYTTDPNYNPLRGGLVGGPDDDDAWSDDRDMNNPANTANLLNTAGFSAAVSGLVNFDINMAKCQQGNGFIQAMALKVKGMPDAAGQRWWEGV